VYKGDSPIKFVWSLNGERRHLQKGPLANIAVKMLPSLKEEAKKRMLAGKTDPTGELREGVQGEAVEHAGKVVGVSGTSVQRAKFVAENDSELSKKIDTGKITINAAYKKLKAKLKAKEKQPKTKDTRIAMIKKMSGKGYRADQIAEKVGVRVAHVRKLAREVGIPSA